MLAPGASYVAMGSSFAAGPGVTTPADQPPTRCARSQDNYAHLLAREAGAASHRCQLQRRDHRAYSWPLVGLAPQSDALGADTQLVTITIGGNDVGYLATLVSASCQTLAAAHPGAATGGCPDAPAIAANGWDKLEPHYARSSRRCISARRARGSFSSII